MSGPGASGCPPGSFGGPCMGHLWQRWRGDGRGHMAWERKWGPKGSDGHCRSKWKGMCPSNIFMHLRRAMGQFCMQLLWWQGVPLPYLELYFSTLQCFCVYLQCNCVIWLTLAGHRYTMSFRGSILYSWTLCDCFVCLFDLSCPCRVGCIWKAHIWSATATWRWPSWSAPLTPLWTCTQTAQSYCSCNRLDCILTKWLYIIQ